MLLEIKILPRKNPSSRGKPPRVCILKCDVCSKIYEGDISNGKKDFHRCSLECVYGSRKTDGIGGHGAEVVVLNCDHCNKQLNPQNKNIAAKFCNRKCYGLWRAAHPEVYKESLVMMQSPESRKKAIETRERRINAGEIKHGRLGKKHSKKTKRLISQHHKETGCFVGPKNGMFGRKHTDEAKEKMSKMASIRIQTGKVYGKTGHMSGKYFSIKTQKETCYRSSWELKLMQYLDESDFVESWEYEPIRIPYYYNDNKRWYVPDFIVTFTDGSKRMYEIKPKEFIKSKRSIAKQQAAETWCIENSISGYQLLTGDCLRFVDVL